MCPYAKDESEFRNIKVKCTLTGNYCGMVRFCSSRGIPLMSQMYYSHGCTIKNTQKTLKRGEEELGKNKKKDYEVVDNDTNIKLTPRAASTTEELAEVLHKIEQNNPISEINGIVNYSNPKKNISNISVVINGTLQAVTVDGIYTKGKVCVISYTGEFCKENILEIIEK